MAWSALYGAGGSGWCERFCGALVTDSRSSALGTFKTPERGCGVKLGLVYAVNPRLSRYSMGLGEPKDILIRFSLYQ